MSFRSKQELLQQTAPRYQEATEFQKVAILNEFVAATGYARKYAIRVLNHPGVLHVEIARPRAHQYGPAVQEALHLAWLAANRICAKRLVPFLPTLIESLERHGHLHLTNEVRQQLFTISSATADRLLHPYRVLPRSRSTTRAGTLLKKQIPIRTFQGWNDAQPGFLEIDLVAHCGTLYEGSYLYTLTLTDVATGWTECVPLLHRGQALVIQAFNRARQLLPFPMLGLDTDNGGEFINAEVLAYCEREHITFTRGRTHKSNDQCYVEQKNGAIVRQVVGYDRFSGEAASRQLAELYRALRLYVNIFQPSMKLQSKRREGSHVHRKYDAAQTPLERLRTAGVLEAEQLQALEQVALILDPLQLLSQLERLQKALWRRDMPSCPPHNLIMHLRMRRSTFLWSPMLRTNSPKRSRRWPSLSRCPNDGTKSMKRVGDPMTGGRVPIRLRASGSRLPPGSSPTPSAPASLCSNSCKISILAASATPRCAPCNAVSRSYALAFCSPLMTRAPRHQSMDNPRPQSYARWPRWEPSKTQGEEGNHALRWCSLASPWTLSIPPR